MKQFLAGKKILIQMLQIIGVFGKSFPGSKPRNESVPFITA